ncbi:FkbM family methyltransferase, partial [Chloroflexota bacterium]
MLFSVFWHRAFKNVFRVIFSFYQRAHASWGYRLSGIPGALRVVMFFFRLLLFFLPRIIDVRGSKMHTDPHEAAFFVTAALNPYESFETQIFEQVVKEGDTVVDLGANVGYYTLLASRIVGERGKVCTFEPDPKTYDLLLKNIELNKYSNIDPVPKAVTNKVGTAKFFLSHEPGANTLHQHKGSGRFIEVETETLDHFFQNRGEIINFIKMDIEGGEMDALSGMDRLISQNRNLKMFVEFVPGFVKRSGHSPEKLLDKLWSYNFKVFLIDEREKRLKYIN